MINQLRFKSYSTKIRHTGWGKMGFCHIFKKIQNTKFNLDDIINISNVQYNVLDFQTLISWFYKCKSIIYPDLLFFSPMLYVINMR